MMTSTANEELIEAVGSCPSCDSKNFKPLKTPSQWIDADHFVAVKDHLGLSSCANCRLVITNPRPSLGLLTSFYNKPGYECHELHFEGAQAGDAKARFEIIEAHCQKGVFLDYGCGSGNMLKAALARGWNRAAGIEIGENARSVLKNQNLEVYADLKSAEALRGQVDAVTMIQVLEHVVEPGPVLNGISEMLRPGGVFVVEVPNAGSLRALIAGSVFSGLFSRHVQRYQAFPIHLYHFEAPQLEALLRKHGFRVIAFQTLGMGVEELWARPPGAANGKVPTQLPSSRSDGGHKSSGLSSLKGAVKSTMSRLKWGEQLIAVCVRA
jgi:SAM-dependent methyltransferase